MNPTLGSGSHLLEWQNEEEGSGAGSTMPDTVCPRRQAQPPFLSVPELLCPSVFGVGTLSWIREQSTRALESRYPPNLRLAFGSGKIGLQRTAIRS